MRKSELKHLIKEIVEDILSEAKDYDLKSFKDLPDRAPYGFLIWPNSTISVIGTVEGHGPYIWDSITKNPKLVASDYVSGAEEYRGYDVYDVLEKKGLLQLVFEGRLDGDALWIRGKGNRANLKLAKDIALMYGVDYFEEPHF